MAELARRISFAVGFLSLSQEILWIRLVGFGHGGRPFAFSIVLTAFLLGIAIGALIGRQRCLRSPDLVRESGRLLIIGGFVDIATIFLAPFALLPHGLSIFLLFVLVCVAAALKGSIFPIVHQLGSSDQAERLGRSVSRVYVANVAGSTLGPLVTGFILLQYLDAGRIFGLIGIVTVLIGLMVFYRNGPWTRDAKMKTVLALTTACVVVLMIKDPLALIATRAGPEAKLGPMIQNRQGVVHLVSDVMANDWVTYGGNVYDGRIGVDMGRNENHLNRAYLMATLHPAPKRVLVIGLSTGAWTRVIAGFPGVEHIDVVEINPAYLQLIRNSPEASSILDDPRVHVHIDDGRRWLRAHPEHRYDLIFQNTTFHWRAYTSMLLSQEYFQELRRHLLPGAIVSCNSTGSPDVYFTAMQAFPNVIRYENFVYMSESPLVRHPRAEQVLRMARIGNKPAFDDKLFLPGAIGANLLQATLDPAQDYLLSLDLKRKPEVITDLNLLTELRRGKPPPFPWLAPMLPASETIAR